MYSRSQQVLHCIGFGLVEKKSLKKQGRTVLQDWYCVLNFIAPPPPSTATRTKQGKHWVQYKTLCKRNFLRSWLCSWCPIIKLRGIKWIQYLPERMKIEHQEDVWGGSKMCLRHHLSPHRDVCILRKYVLLAVWCIKARSCCCWLTTIGCWLFGAIRFAPSRLRHVCPHGEAIRL